MIKHPFGMVFPLLIDSRRVHIKHPWMENLSTQQKRRVGTKYVLVHKWHVVSVHHPTNVEILPDHVFYYI